jgi:hypothetical protein
MTDMMGWFLYENKTKLLAAGWTIKFTCDGTVPGSPSGPTDTTDRWTSIATASIRGTAAGTAQSYAVLQNADGLQILFAYQGAGLSPTGDDIGRISYSPGGLFVLASPSTNQPTATDEVVTSAANSLVNATASQDRVLHIWTTTDTKHWSCLLARGGNIQTAIGVERVISYCGVNVFDVPYVGYRHQNFAKVFSPPILVPSPCGSINTSLGAIGAAGYLGTHARVFTNAASRLVRVAAGAIFPAGQADSFNRSYFADLFMFSNNPALQGGVAAPLYPIVWSGEKATNLDGILGSPIDWWLCHTAVTGVPAATNMHPGFDLGDNPNIDPVRSNWMVAIGAEMVRPWRNAAAAMLLS